MGPRPGFVLSLLAAFGIHAVVLLVPRAAIIAEAPIPTVELDLWTTPEQAEGSPAVTQALASPAAARRTERATRPASGEAAPMEASRPSVPIEPPASVPSVDQPPTVSASPGIAEESDSHRTQPGAGATSVVRAASSASSSGGAAGTAAAAAPASVLIPPRPLAEILPPYPMSARRAGFEGLVKVAAMVDASGSVTSAEVVVSSGHASLDRAVLETVRRTLFSPALRDGKPVPWRIVIPCRFVISAASRD